MIESIEFLTYRQRRVVLPLRDPWGIGVAVKFFFFIDKGYI